MAKGARVYGRRPFRCGGGGGGRTGQARWRATTRAMVASRRSGREEQQGSVEDPGIAASAQVGHCARPLSLLAACWPQRPFPPPRLPFADHDSNVGNGANAASYWNFTAAEVCLQELAVVAALSDWTDDRKNNCSNRNVIDHSSAALPPDH